MAKRELLFSLVRSLSKSEKRHFSIFCKAYKDNNKYIAIFNSLIKMDVYEKEVFLKDKSLGIASESQLAIQKQYIQRQLMRSLRLFHENQSVNMEIQNGLCEIEILYNKRLGWQCTELIRRMRKLAEDYEKYGLLIQVFEWERKLKYLFDKPEREELEITEDEALALRKNYNSIQYERLFSKAMEFKKKHGYVNGKARDDLYQEVINNRLLRSASSCLSQTAEYYFYFTNTLSNMMIQEEKKAYFYSRKMIELNPQIIGGELFFNGLLQHITSCVCLGFFGETLSLLDKTEELLNSPIINTQPQLKLRYFYYWSNYSLYAYTYMGDKEGIVKTIDEIKKQVNTVFNPISKEMLMVLNSNLKNAYFLIGDIKSTQQTLVESLSNMDKTIRNDTYVDSLLFSLFFWLETKEYSLLESSINTTDRYFKQVAKNYEDDYFMEISICKYFKQVKDYTDDKELRKLYQNVKSTIYSFIEKHKGLNDFYEQVFIFVIIANSKLNKTTYVEEAKTWYKNHNKTIKFEN